ncbi:MAG: cation diffusion facilitator family transporter [Sulfolobales archaeon]
MKRRLVMWRRDRSSSDRISYLDPRVTLILISLSSSLAILVLRISAYLYSGSLAILADSIHSFSDIAAGVIALIALKVALKEPDSEHPYGHGKAESLGSLGISVALIAVLVYISYEAMLRALWGYGVEVEFTPMISIMIGSTIAIDLWRSRALSRGAKKYGSIILASDALHYRSDLYATSSVLILSILGIVLGRNPLLSILDLVIAIIIASYFAFAAVRLAKTAIDDLMDRAPGDVIELFKTVCNDLGVGVKSVRARRSGPRIFIDAVIEAPGDMELSEAHRLADELEERVRMGSRHSVDMVIHIEPADGSRSEEIARSSSEIASKVAGVLGVHDVEVYGDEKGYHVRMHVEVSPSISLEEASRIAVDVEKAVKEHRGDIASVLVHIEPRRSGIRDIHRIVYKILEKEQMLRENIRLRGVRALYIRGGMVIDIICTMPRNLDVSKAHEIVSKLESMIKEELGKNVSVNIRYSADY